MDVLLAMLVFVVVFIVSAMIAYWIRWGRKNKGMTQADKDKLNALAKSLGSEKRY